MTTKIFSPLPAPSSAGDRTSRNISAPQNFFRWGLRDILLFVRTPSVLYYRQLFCSLGPLLVVPTSGHTAHAVLLLEQAYQSLFCILHVMPILESSDAWTRGGCWCITDAIYWKGNFPYGNYMPIEVRPSCCMRAL
jgi:hypothetical protein